MYSSCQKRTVHYFDLVYVSICLLVSLCVYISHSISMAAMTFNFENTSVAYLSIYKVMTVDL